MCCTVLAIKEELVEVIQPLPSGLHSKTACGVIVDFAVPPIKQQAEASASGAHPRAHRGADSDTLRAADQGANRGFESVSASGTWMRGHRGTELPKKCRRRKRQKGKTWP